MRHFSLRVRRAPRVGLVVSEGGFEPPRAKPTAPSRQRVYLFHHSDEVTCDSMDYRCCQTSRFQNGPSTVALGEGPFTLSLMPKYTFSSNNGIANQPSLIAF